MRNIILFTLLLIIGFSSCKKDEDTSVLTGTWQSTGVVEMDIKTNNEEATQQIEKEIERLGTENKLVFLDNGTFEITYTDGSFFGTGTYFRKDGKLYAQYYVGIGRLGASVLSLVVTDNEILTSLHDATDYFRNDLQRLVEDPTGITISTVSIKAWYARQSPTN